MSNDRDLAAQHIIENLHSYSDDEIINAIRYLGRTKNVKLLTYFFTPSARAYLFMRKSVVNFRLSSRARPARADITLEVIKQFYHLDDLSPFKNMLLNPTSFSDIHFFEAIKISGEKGYTLFLSEITKNPINFKEEIRKRASDELFRARELPIFEAIPKEKDVRTRSHHRVDEVKQVFISYKKADRSFTDNVVNYLTDFHSHEFEIIYDNLEIVAGDSLPQKINSMLDRYETCIMIWTPAYFQEAGWAQIEKDALLNKRVRDKKRFVPILLKGKISDIPPIMSHYVFVDFRDYEKEHNPVVFTKRMQEVVTGLKKEE